MNESTCACISFTNCDIDDDAENVRHGIVGRDDLWGSFISYYHVCQHERLLSNFYHVELFDDEFFISVLTFLMNNCCKCEKLNGEFSTIVIRSEKAIKSQSWTVTWVKCIKKFSLYDNQKRFRSLNLGRIDSIQLITEQWLSAFNSFQQSEVDGKTIQQNFPLVILVLVYSYSAIHFRTIHHDLLATKTLLSEGDWLSKDKEICHKNSLRIESSRWNLQPKHYSLLR